MLRFYGVITWSNHEEPEAVMPDSCPYIFLEFFLRYILVSRTKPFLEGGLWRPESYPTY